MKTLVFIGASLLALQAAAADPVLNWWSVDGGGTTSSGGGFTVSGTIGQPDAGLMGGGGFTLNGGFWPGLVPEPLRELRIVRIFRESDGAMTVEWIGGGTLLEAPTVLGPWQDVLGATSPYTFTPPGPMLFLRIRQ
jgi:hypothetical protein